SEALTLTAADNAADLTSATLAVTVGPDRLELSGPSPILAGTCQQYTVTTKDTAGNTANAAANVTVNLGDGAALGAFYADADNTCAGTAITSITVTAGQSSANFRYKDNRAESVTLAASDASGTLTGDTHGVSVGPDRLALAGPASVKSGICSAAFTVTSRDATNTAANALANLTIDLTDGSATGTFHELADCSDGPVTQVTLAGASSSKTFYFRDTTGAALTIAVADNAGNLTGANATLNVGPDHLQLAGSASPVSGACTLYTVTTHDTANNPVNVLTNTQVNLSDAAAAGVFYAAGDTTCAGAAVSSVSIAAGNGSVTFRYKDNTAQSVTLTASDNAGSLTSATLNIDVGPDRLIISGTTPVRSGTCNVFTVRSRDTAGNFANVLANTQVNLGDGAANGDFYALADNTCAGAPIANVTISSGSDTASFRYRDDTAEAVTLTGTDNGAVLTAASFNLEVGPDHLDLAGPTSVKSGTCSTAFTITTRDTANNLTNVVSNTQVNLTDGSATGTFHTAADCSSAAITSITISSGNNTATVYFKDTVGGSKTIGVADNAASLTGDSSSLDVGPDHLELTGAATPVAGSCQTYTVTAKDTAGNATNVLAAVTVNLGDASAAGVFYAAGDATCSGAPVATVSIGLGASSTTFKYRNAAAEAATLSAADNAGDLTTATLNVTTGPDRFNVTGTTPIKSGTCALYTVTSQ
ncbi:MAG TPA: hypothetical protein VFV50_07070, partial [Bdellovibrionales bacterium]|nr:hypothetical protein [Bdellovibrionales bacterium]